MTKKNFLIILILLILSSVILFTSFIYIQKQHEKNLRGTYTFSNTKDNIHIMKTIKIKNNENEELTIYREKDVWKIKEAADYYVNPHILVNFYDMIHNSIITTVLEEEYNDETENKTIIETYSEDNNLLDRIILGKEAENKKYKYAVINNNSISYLINNTEKFSSDLYDWVPHPLLRLPYQDISFLEIDGKKINKNILEKILPYYEEIAKGLKFFSYMTYESIIKKEDIFKIIPQDKPHNITITISSGIMYSFDIYKTGDLYLISITLNTTRIPRKEANEFVKNNQPYYSDWLFAINSDIGSILYNLTLID